MKNIFFLFGFLLSLQLASGQQKDYFVKKVEFPSGAGLEQKLDMAAHLVPSKGQYEWQQLELTAFIHFGINTFTGREWGTGKEDPALFNPTELDAEQWIKVLKKSGFKMVILTAKHHDGFCLWPTKTTKHSVASSPWKNGEGDVVKELKAASDKYGMKFGVYLSPWDRNAECYGDSPRYNRMFMEQLSELLTNYGKIHEIWFDGANAEGPNGKKQIYDWKAFYAVMDSLQPDAVRAIMGDDVRWVGNEKGIGRETEWSATALVSGIYESSDMENKRLGIYDQAPDLGSRNILAKAERLFWYPSEVDVSIRPGWFYHADQDNQVKSLPHLVDIYFQSVGYNSVLLLNVPPDRRGLIHEKDVLRLKEFGTYLEETFRDNKLADTNTARDFMPGDAFEYAIRSGELVNTFMIQEDICRGQHIESFILEALVAGVWRELARGTTVGYKRLLRFPACRAEKIRLVINESRNMTHVKEVGAFYAYPLNQSDNGIKISDIPVNGWKVIACDSETPENLSGYAVDANRETAWVSLESKGKHSITVDMGEKYNLKGFSYVPVHKGEIAGTIYKYNFYVSTDNKSWETCVREGEFSNIMHNPVPQFIRFEKDYPARYFRFESLQEVEGRLFIVLPELGVLLK